MKKRTSAPRGQDITRTIAGGVEVLVAVLPRSSRCAVVGVQGGRLKLKLTKPPVDGQANAECCRFVAELLGICRTRVCVAHGHAVRRKVVRIAGMDEAEVVRKLNLA